MRVVLGALLLSGAANALAQTTALAIDVELNDVAADRVERQRAYTRGQLPLAATPDLARLDERLAAKGLAKGRPIFIRIFKATSELEIWMQKAGDKAFMLLDTYPICNWTGTLGPKLREGDRQSPEGFYSVVNRQMRLVGRWQKAFNIGFPNVHDQLNKRTGSFILVHGGCSSVGCFAMTEQVQEEIYALANAAIAGGQERFHVHIFPFRMTEDNLAANAANTWAPFWRDLQVGHDSFERTRVPPRVAMCEHRYQVADGEPGEIGDQKPLSLLRPGALSAAANASSPTTACVPEARAAVIVTGALGVARPSVAVASAAKATSADRDDEDEPRTVIRRKVRATQQSTPWTKSNSVSRPSSAPSPNGFDPASRQTAGSESGG